jgi:tetratricopeptide (TPR) repeat protein
MTDTCLGNDTLVDFLDGRAEPKARARIEEHAAQCTSCREVLSSLARSGTPRAATPALTPALVPGIRIGRYVVAREIGAGGMGVVYAAHDPELDRMVAVKVLRGGNDRLRERLRREAQSMAQLAHPNVVAVYDVGTFDDSVFIGMEYVAGDTLAGWLSTPRSQREILDAYCSAGRGLAAAHAAGIVHRDFKPENVLIGNDDRVRVGDFGLARTTATAGGIRAANTEAAEMPAGARPSVPSVLTAAGTLLGTPYYMAPELYRGAEASSRSDQFSFCVALFTALYDERPFEDDMAAGADAPDFRLRAPQARRRVSRRVHAAIQRGLEIDPAARFASLDELLAELVPRPRRIWWIGMTAFAVVAWLVARSSVAVPDRRCTGAEAAFATAWNFERRVAVAAAFEASPTPHAAAALERVAGVLDQYAARWTQAHTGACRATRILGEQSEGMLELRMMCLDRRRQEVAALVDALAIPGAGMVARSMEAAVALTDVAACAATAEPGRIDPPPTDTAARAKLDDLTSRLADASAKYRTGALAPALELARSISTEAHELAYRPFEAEARLLQGILEYELGDLAHAEPTLETAVWAAEAGRHDVIAGRAWIRLMVLIGLGKQEFARASALAPRVTAVIARLGGDSSIEAYLERTLGGIESRQNNLVSALSHTEKALDFEERASGSEHLNVAMAQENVGIVLLNQGQVDRAMRALQRAHQIYERTLVPDHPWMARILHNLGKAHIAANDDIVAEQVLRDALAIRETALGPRHPKLPDVLADLGRAVRQQGRLEEALSHHRRGVEIAQKALPPGHIELGGAFFELGITLGMLDRHAEADDFLRRAEAIATKALGPECVLVMWAKIARGDVFMRQSRWAAAAALYEHALPILEKSPGTAETSAGAVAHLGQAYVELHRPARARALLEPLASTLNHQRPEIRTVAEFALARAQWDTGGDRVQARELASRARADIRVAVTSRRQDITQIERWLAGHPTMASKKP